MDKKVLVAYGSKYGATAAIAERVGQELEQAGLAVDVLPAETVSDLGAYGAVVLGGGLYAGHWHKAAASFLRGNEATLSTLPVWLFSSGPTGAGDPVALLQGFTFPTDLKAMADRIHARDKAVFGGAIDEARLSFLDRLIIKGVKAPTGDFRNWPAIEVWSKSIATGLSRAN